MTAAACIVLAGGLGTRLRSAVPDRPKCLAPVGSRSFLEIQLQALRAAGFAHIVLALGHQAEMVLAAIQGWGSQGLRIDAVVEPQPLGTGGAVLLAMDALRGLPGTQPGEPVDEAVVVNGDTHLQADLAAMHGRLALQGEAGEAMRLAAIEVPDRARYGGLALDGTPAAGQTAVVTGFLEKGQQGPGLINAGIYRIHRRAFDALPGTRPGDALSLESRLMPLLVQQRRLHATPLTGAFIDIGVPEDYHRFCALHGAAPP